MMKLIGGEVLIQTAPGLHVPIGKLVDAQVLRLEQARPLNEIPPAGARSISVSWEMTGVEEAGLLKFNRAYRRRLDLRQQLKNKGRPGWRHVRITGTPRFEIRAALARYALGATSDDA